MSDSGARVRGDDPMLDADAAFALILDDAHNGDPAAQVDVGLACYCCGPDGFSHAAQWWMLAAEGGDPIGQHHLGLAYLRGQGVAHDPALAQFWLQQAAHQGLADAMAMLGTMSLGLIPGVPADHVTAYSWFRLAVERGRGDVCGALELLSQVMAPAAVDEARAMARDHHGRRPI